MKISLAVALLSTLVSCSQAWVPPHLEQRAITGLNASRAAAKKASKRAWLQMRGSSSEASTTTEIIGGGRIGSLLAEAGNAIVLGRGDSIDPNGSGPILIATRNDALEGIVAACPEHRRADLVFLQNGYLDNFLSQHGLMENTQALLFFSVTAKGADPVDGVTQVNPEGLTTATGRHAQALAYRLAELNLKCNVVDAAAYRPAMFEKLIWISTYMLVGTAKGCTSVGHAALDHGDLVSQVVTELAAAVENKEGLQFAPGTLERLASYTDVVADFPCGVKEFAWRNEYFYRLECPTHNGLLRECQEQGLLGFELP